MYDYNNKCVQRLNPLPLCDCIVYKHVQCRVPPVNKTDPEDQLTFLHNKEQLPIYVLGCKKFLTTQEIMNVLLDSDLNMKSVCSQVPFAVASNAVFIVDLSKLEAAKDILCDDMGSWKWSGSFRRWCSVSSEGFVKLLGKDEPENGLPCDAYHIWKRYYSLQASPDLKKMVVILEGRKISHDELVCYNTFHFNN